MIPFEKKKKKCNGEKRELSFTKLCEYFFVGALNVSKVCVQLI